MAPFFKREIIDRFLIEFTKYTGLEILTNEDDHARLQPILPIIMENASEICRGSIGDTYLENTIMDNAFGVDTIFDTAIILEHGDPVPIGFIVVEKGECKRRGYENVWSVNLICAKETSRGGKSGLGQILMGLYLYTISHNDSIQPKTAILELANGYINAGGLASYMKLGFVVDESLYGRNCFEDYGNLPMAVRELHPTRIISILNGQDAGYPKLPICSIRGDLQLYLGLCKNLYTFIEKNAEEYIDSKYELADKRIINFDLLETKLYEEFARIHNIAGKKRKKTNSQYNEWLKGYIVNIETNHSTINTGDLIGFSLLNKIVTPAQEKKKAQVLEKMERRLRSGLRIGVVPTPVSRQRSHGGRSNHGRSNSGPSKRNKKSNRRKTKKT